MAVPKKFTELSEIRKATILTVFLWLRVWVVQVSFSSSSCSDAIKSIMLLKRDVVSRLDGDNSAPSDTLYRQWPMSHTSSMPWHMHPENTYST